MLKKCDHCCSSSSTVLHQPLQTQRVTGRVPFQNRLFGQEYKTILAQQPTNLLERSYMVQWTYSPGGYIRIINNEAILFKAVVTSNRVKIDIVSKLGTGGPLNNILLYALFRTHPKSHTISYPREVGKSTFLNRTLLYCPHKRSNKEEHRGLHQHLCWGNLLAEV